MRKFRIKKFLLLISDLFYPSVATPVASGLGAYWRYRRESLFLSAPSHTTASALPWDTVQPNGALEEDFPV